MLNFLMENSLKVSDIFNLCLGILSIIGILSGFFIPSFRLVFWIVSITLLIFVVIGYYVADNRRQISIVCNKINKIEESLNIYDRLNKLELAIKMKKRGQINLDLLDIIKIGLAIILIIVFIKAILSITGY